MMLHQIQKKYPGNSRFLFQKLSLKLAKNRLIALLGPSGVGKTTLLWILALLEPFDGGDFFIDQESIATWSEEKKAHWRRRNLGVLPQHPMWMEHLTLFDNLMLRCGETTANQQKVNVALETWGLAEMADRRPRQLSGGQLQRLAWIRATIHSPRFILADEPTNHLDKENAERLMESARQQVHLGCSVLLSTHQLSIAMQCDEVWTLSAHGLIDVS